MTHDFTDRGTQRVNVSVLVIPVYWWSCAVLVAAATSVLSIDAVPDDHCMTELRALKVHANIRRGWTLSSSTQ